MDAPIGCAVIGYGPLHHFGWAHCAWIDAAPDLRLVAVCDRDPSRLEAARRDFPFVRTYASAEDAFAQDDIDLVSIVTPHFTHAPLAVQALRAGKHVVVEKAMCLNVSEADAMIDAARAAGRMLAVHHNRRHDGNYRAIKEAVRGGAIGRVFHIELTVGGYGLPAHGWYTEKAKSGGTFYFWGPHAVDWVLDLAQQRVAGVTGFFHKLKWMDVDVEDHVRAILRFEDGSSADITHSHLSAHQKPLWRILGTEGAIVDTGRGGNAGYEKQIAGPSAGSFTLIRYEAGERRECQVPYKDSDWLTYWLDVSDHLLRGAPVPVSGEFGRRVIGVLETAEKSARTGRTEPLPHEDEFPFD